MGLISQISQQIATVTGGDFVCSNQQSLGGGCINTAFRLDGDDLSYFVKTNSADMLDMFVAEAAGLQAMADTKTIRIPEPVCHGVADGQSFLVLEYLEFGGGRSIETLGEQLAAMHRHTNDEFGFHIDNTIGSTHQDNTPHKDWVSFWQQCRLGFQLNLAKQNGCGRKLLDSGEKLLTLIPQFYTDYQPLPSLLHGDLWGGNYSFSKEGQPVIFDPATYYGDREADPRRQSRTRIWKRRRYPNRL